MNLHCDTLVDNLLHLLDLLSSTVGHRLIVLTLDSQGKENLVISKS